MLNLSPQVIQHIKDGGPYCHLVELALSPSTLYFCDSSFDVIEGGHTYLGNGILRAFDAVTIRNEITVNKTKIEFTAVEQSMVAILLANNQLNRLITISRAYLNDDGTVLGKLQLMQLQVSGEPSSQSDQKTAKITLPAASIWADFDKINGRRSTTASQQKHFPNDTGHFAASEAGKEYKWGRK